MRTLGCLIVASVLLGAVWAQPEDEDIDFGWNEDRQRFPLKAGDGSRKRSASPRQQGRSKNVVERIINGEVSEYGKHPYICSLEKQENYQWFFVCGAVIYNENTLLTAAHCVDQLAANTLRVRCGDFHLLDYDEFEVNRSIAMIKLHPKWEDDGYKGFPNDLALLKVDSPLYFNDHINTIRIANRKSKLPKHCQLVGWGVTESGDISMELREVTIRRLPQKKCKKVWGRYINKGHICFMDEGEPDSSCNGDSGGPAVCGKFLVGVTSWGVDNCIQGYPSVYTRLSKYKKWIRKSSFK